MCRLAAVAPIGFAIAGQATKSLEGSAAIDREYYSVFL